MEGKKAQLPTTEHPAAMAEQYENNACVRWCFTEFESESINLEHERPVDFLTSQWTGRSRVYIVYRVLMAVAFLGWVSGDVVYETSEFYQGQAWRWLVFASNWSFAILAVSAILHAVTCTIYEYRSHWIIDPVYFRTMPVLLKVQWVLFNMSCNSALVVTTGYWAFIAFVSNTPLLTSNMSRLKHTINSIYVVADVLIGATPIRMYHLVYTVFLGSLYIVFNALYFTNNGSLLLRGSEGADSRTYYFMNWSSPVEAICTCVLGVLMSGASQIVLHALYHLRLWIHQKFFPDMAGGESELQNIITASASYNSLEDGYGERALDTKRP